MRLWLTLPLIAISSQIYALSEPQQDEAPKYDVPQYLADKSCTEKYTSGNFAIAVTSCERAAIKGDAASQTILGKMYYFGHGVISNNEKAAHWFQIAAGQGNPEAQYFLGRMYSAGIGFERNHAEAFKFFLMAAKQGDATAQMVVSMMYRIGLGTPKDSDLAFEWYESARKNGLEAPEKIREDFAPKIFRISPNHPGEEAYQTGLALLMGIRGEPDPEQALPLFIEAANMGHQQAQFNLGLMYLKGDGTDRNDTQALEWFLLASENMHRDAQAYLAWMSFLGLGTPNNQAEAMEWYIQSIEPTKEALKAQEKVKAKEMTPGSIEWLKKQAESGDPEAQTKLGMMYLHGNQMSLNRLEGFKLIRQAALQDYAEAEYQLAILYLEGEGVIQDVKTGIYWLRKASSHNHPQAHYELGLLYYNGLLVKQNYQQAYAWFNLAAGQDVVEAKTARNSLIKRMDPAQVASAEALSRELYQQLNP